MDTIRRADYFSMEVPNKIGEGARLLGALRDAGINLTAFTAFPSGRRAQIDFMPDDSAAFKADQLRSHLLAVRSACASTFLSTQCGFASGP